MDDNNLSQNNDDLPKFPLPHNDGITSDDHNPPDNQDLAANLIRQKLNAIYGDGPSVKQELEEIKNTDHLSKHQKFIKELQSSGKSIAEIQTEWHEYYVQLPDNEKKRVWQEFYAANKHINPVSKHIQPHYSASPDSLKAHRQEHHIKPPDSQSHNRVSIVEEETIEKKTAAEVKNELLQRVQRRNGGWYQRFRSLIFGLSVGAFVILLFLFSFFNDRFIAPFITPSRNVSAQSLIVSPNGQAVGPNPIIIIPKINVEIPVIYNLPLNTTEDQIENNLENGVVHYPTTADPGQNGNGAIFGHSSNNILNPGKYKFAFVLLHTLQIGDTFTLDYQGKAYVYQIFQRQIVSPNDVSVLNNIPGHTATFTLITCDPPGTSINRLVVVGNQISPSITNNITGPDQDSAPKPAILPSNSPSLWSRFVQWL